MELKKWQVKQICCNNDVKNLSESDNEWSENKIPTPKLSFGFLDKIWNEKN